jgi:hypothetical protein
LFPDPKDPNKDKSWWEVNWQKAVQWIVFAMAVIATVLVAIANPAVGAAMFSMCIKGALTGMAIGGALGGMISAAQGGDFWEGLIQGAVYGAMNGYTVSAIMYGLMGAPQAIPKKSACFAAGTLVLALNENGEASHKPIEKIEVGDSVKAFNEQTGQYEWRKVTRLFRNTTSEWHHIEANGEDIKCTGGHPFFVTGISLSANAHRIVRFEGTELNENAPGYWIAAKDLKISDTLLLSDGKRVTISQTWIESLAKPETTFNFEVEGLHNYHVGTSGICVHNACPLTRAQARNIKTIRNNIDHHLTNSDIAAALGDVQGSPVINASTGQPWQHLKEVQNAYRGISKASEALQASLANPNLSAAARTIITEAVNEANLYIDLLDDLFFTFGGL